MRRAALVPFAAALLAAACADRSAAPQAPVDDGTGAVWTADPQLERAWHVRYPDGNEIGVTFGAEEGVDVVFLSVWPRRALRDGGKPAPDQRVHVELAGAAPDTALGKTSAHLGWHLTDPERDYRAGEDVSLDHQRLLSLRADRAFGTDRLRRGTSYRFDLVFTAAGTTERVPVAWRTPE